MKKTISIFTYSSGILGLKKEWMYSRMVSWLDYEKMAKNYSGEGITWKAEII